MMDIHLFNGYASWRIEPKQTDMYKPDPDTEPNNFSSHRIIGSTADKPLVNKLINFLYNNILTIEKYKNILCFKKNRKYLTLVLFILFPFHI